MAEAASLRSVGLASSGPENNKIIVQEIWIEKTRKPFGSNLAFLECSVLLHFHIISIIKARCGKRVH